MIIGINGNEANIKNRVGVNKYAFEILKGLKKINEEKPNPSSLIVYLENLPLPDLPKETKYFKYKVLSGGKLWVLTKLTPYLFKNPEKIDVLFSPNPYTPPILPIPRVCAVMDLGYLEFTGQFKKLTFWQLKYWTAISVFTSKQVLTISDDAKKDIVRHYPSASKKVTVTLLGFEQDRFNLNVPKNLVRQVKNKYSIVSDYFLFLSTLKPSKNVEGLIDAYFILSQRKGLPSLPQLVIGGKKGWMYDGIFKKVKELGLEDKLIFTDFVEENDKPPLIAGAKAFTLPSFWEGFGIDVLSAFGCGIPAIVSNVGSLPEVGGKAALYVNPNDPKTIANAMEKVLNMTKLEYNKLVKLGIDQAKKFSWQECSSKTLEVIENAVQR